MAEYCRTRGRSPGRWSSAVTSRPSGSARPTKTVPAGFPSCFGRASDAGDAETHVRADDPASADGHRPGRVLGHHRTVGQPEHGELDRAVVGDDPAPEPPAAPGNVDDTAKR